jgi:hypothetical protein
MAPLIAKRRDSLYESGRRSHAWVKVKVTQQQEFVGRYRRSEGNRKYFGAQTRSNPIRLAAPFALCDSIG